MRGVLQKLKDDGKTVFINSHLLQEVELVCDRVAILDKGELRREGLIEEITRRDETEVEFVLAGEGPAIRSALTGFQIAQCNEETAGQLRVTVQLADQSVVDRCIDELRKAGISIVSLSRRRDTLEEAFLGIVSQGAPAPVVLAPLPPARY